MAIPESFITEVTERNDIESVVSEYVALNKRTGSNIFGLCPFHSEKTPSFSVNTAKQIYYCFGCHKGGGVINFIMEIENVGYVDAVSKLAARAGLQMPENDDPQAKLRSRLYDLNRDAARYFRSCLLGPEGQPARDYVNKRQLTPTTVTNFGLGYAPDGWHGLMDAMKAKGYSEQELYAADLVKPGSNGKSFHDSFRNRLMFPVIDTAGHVIGFSGRILGDGEPKYLNSKNTPVFDKGKNLFGLNLAKRTKSGSLLLVEGNVDVVSLHQAGFDSAVASLGTSLTEKQAQLISRYVDSVIIAYDSDGAGRDATKRALDIFSKLDMKVKVLRMEGAKDPDEYIKTKGADAFQKLLDGSEQQMDYKLRLIAEKYDLAQPEQKVDYLKEAENTVASLTARAQREVYSRVIADRAAVKADAVISDVEAMRRSKERRGAAQEQRNLLSMNSQRKYENVSSATAEEGLISLLLKDPSLISLPDLPPPEKFSDERLRAVYAAVTERLREHRPLTVDLLSQDLTSEQLSILVELADRPLTLAKARDAAADCISRIGVAPPSFADLQNIIAAKQNR